MTNEEAIEYLIAPIATSTEPSDEYLKQKEAYELAIEALKRPKVVYICKVKGTEYCHHTSNVSMARNFEKVGDNMYEEKER